MTGQAPEAEVVDLPKHCGDFVTGLVCPTCLEYIGGRR